MLYRREAIFLEMLMYAFNAKGIRSIPFSNLDFNNGIDALNEYLKENLDESDYKEISQLFIKRPIYDTYDKLIDGMMGLNGTLCSFAIQNPVWEVLSFNKLSPEIASELLDTYENEDFSKDMIFRAVDEFTSRLKGTGKVLCV